MNNDVYERLSAIIQEMQSGNHEHFEELYDLTKQTVFFELKAVGVPANAIEDQMQEVYIKLVTKVGTIENSRALIRWIRTVSHQTGIDYIKRAVNRHEFLVEEDGEFTFEDEGNLNAPLPMPEDIMENKETQRLMRQIVHSLPSNQFRMVVAYYYNEESVKEIAETMSASESAVKTQLFRARKTIGEKVKELEEKHGTKLYTTAPLPIFALLFGADVLSMLVPSQTATVVTDAVTQIPEYLLKPNGAGNIASNAIRPDYLNAATATKGVAAGTAKVGGMAVGTKVAIGAVVAAVVIGGGGAVITHITDDKDTQIEESEEENTEEENHEEETPSENIEEETEKSTEDTVTLDDGWYDVNMYALGTGRIFIDDGILIVEDGEWVGPGNELFAYDFDKKVDVGDSVRLSVSDNCYIHAQQGDPELPGTDVELSIEDFNMYETLYELGRNIKLENGLITEIYMTS